LVWNHAATQRLGLFGCQVVAGDLVVADSSALRQVKVVEAGEESLFQLAQVVLPLPGSDVVYPQNAVAQVYERILAEDSVEFKKDGGEPESSAKGSYRFLVSHSHRPVQCYKVTGSDSDYHLTFDLSAGSYATMFLRELLRTTSSCTTTGTPSTS
jgi:tRNA(Glu) U13 pseudouridine synthase TruD